jgi:histone H3/H4
MRVITATVYRDIVVAGNWAAHFDPELPPAVAEELAESVPRDLTRVLRSALGAAALAGRPTIRVADLPTRLQSGRRRIGFA